MQEKGEYSILSFFSNRVDQGVAENALCRVAGVRYRSEDVENEGVVDVPKEMFSRHVDKAIATVGVDPEWKSIGLHEALMPLTALTLLDMIKQQSNKDALARRSAEIEMRLSRLHQNKANLTNLVGDGLLSLDDARAKLASLNLDEARLQEELTEAVSMMAATSEDDLAKAYAMLRMVQEGTLPSSLYRTLANRTFKKITCHSVCVGIELSDGTVFNIEKIRRAGVMTMPPFRMDVVPLSDGSHRLEVSYYYSSYFTGKDDLPFILVSTDRLKVYSIGMNNEPEGKDGPKSKLIREGWKADLDAGRL